MSRVLGLEDLLAAICDLIRRKEQERYPVGFDAPEFLHQTMASNYVMLPRRSFQQQKIKGTCVSLSIGRVKIFKRIKKKFNCLFIVASFHRPFYRRKEVELHLQERPCLGLIHYRIYPYSGPRSMDCDS